VSELTFKNPHLWADRKTGHNHVALWDDGGEISVQNIPECHEGNILRFFWPSKNSIGAQVIDWE
jgi:hypothetical protein